MDIELLIDGAFAKGEGQAEQVLNPATGKLIVEVPEASQAQLNAAVAAAARAFESWSQTTPAQRAAASC